MPADINLYDIQKDFISNARNLIKNSQHGIFSSPTGTGKTLSLLYSIKDYINHNSSDTIDSNTARIMKMLQFSQFKCKTTIFYCSRTHSQLNQAINELRRVYKDVNACILGSRRIYCINKDVNKDILGNTNVELINENCSELVKKDACKFYHNAALLDSGAIARDTALVSNPDMRTNMGIVDIEDVTKKGIRNTFCPYFFLKTYHQHCEIVFLPYTLLLSKESRKAVNLNIKDAVIIIDEAHNIYDSLIQMNSVLVTFKSIQKYMDAFVAFKQKYEKRMSESNSKKINLVLEILTKLHLFISRCDGFNADNKPGANTNTTGAAKQKRRDANKKLNDAMSEKCLKINDFLVRSDLYNINMIEIENYLKDSKIAQKLEGFNTNLHFQLFNITRFLLLLTLSDENGRILYNSKHIRFTPLDPRMYFEDIFECKSLILAGGTMEPLDSILSLFSSTEVQYFCYKSICTNFISLVVYEGPSKKLLKLNYERRGTAETLSELLAVILNLCNQVKTGGVICFLPSKFYMTIIQSSISKYNFNKKIFFDEITNYKRDIKKGPCILFSVMGGKLSEGINFSDNLCRLLLVVGVPYPTVTTELLERESFYGSSYSTIVAMKTVNQALGRALRHANDYGAIVLIDSRYRNLMSKVVPWVREKTQVVDFRTAVLEVKKFFKGN